MKAVLLFSMVIGSALFADIESSVKIPASLHYQATFGNHKNHPVQKMQIQHALEMLAPLKRDAIEAKLKEQGLNVGSLNLKEYDTYLVYEGNVQTQEGTRLKLLIDPANGIILDQKEPI